MRRTSVAPWGIFTAGLVVVLVWLICCESPSRRGEPPSPVLGTEPEARAAGAPRAPEDRSRGTVPRPPGEDADAPARPEQSGEVGVIPAPATQPAAPGPELPEFLEIVELFDRAELPTVDVQITSPHRLAIETRNVRRLRIYRDRLPMNTRRSIVLQLDGAGIEWTADSTTFEFERSINGAWSPVRQRQP